MGKLYLASLFLKSVSGEEYTETELVHADIEAPTEHEKALLLGEMVTEKYQEQYPTIKILGCRVKQTWDLTKPKAKQKSEQGKQQLYFPIELVIENGEFGVGDGIHDGFYGQGETDGERAVDFLKKLKESEYVIIKP